MVQWPDRYTINTLDMLSDSWKEISFCSYDVVYHTAAIVHVKESSIDKYFRINRDLTLDVAKKAKTEGVKQFVFLSTMGVYGLETGIVDQQTDPDPKTPYARSKLEAEYFLNELADERFRITILRPPIVYGKGCRGNYPRLAGVVLKLPFFPNVNNERSMIYVDNLSEFVRLIIDSQKGGLFFPQNIDYVNTTELARQIVKVHGKQIITTNNLSLLVSLGMNFSTALTKVFGTFVYDKDLNGSPYEFDYQTCSFEESVKLTEI